MLVPVAWVTFAAGLALWVAVFVALLLITRSREIGPGPPTSEPGPESPAIAGLLAARGRIDRERAATATLVDLAARGHLRLIPQAGDPRLTEVAVQTGPPEWAGLAPYELRVLNRIRDLTTNDNVPLFRLPIRRRKRARSWGAGLVREVVTAARDAGLVRNRFEPVHRMTLLALSGVSAFGLAVLLAAEAAKVNLWVVVALLLALNALPALPWRVRETAAGREAAARALAFREWLRRNPPFPEPPVAGVTTWDRNEAYAVAFGLNRYADKVVDFGVGRRDLMWSPVTGTWRQVHVRYPQDSRRQGATIASARSEIFTDFGLGVVLICFPGSVVLGLPMVVYDQTGSPLVLGLICLGAVALPVLVVWWFARSVSTLGGLRAERDSYVTVRGRVLKVEQWHGRPDDEDARYHLVVDDGRFRDLTAWCMTGPAQCATGDTVEFTALPFSRRVLAFTRGGRPR